jgi:hypothetical protein
MSTIGVLEVPVGSYSAVIQPGKPIEIWDADDLIFTLSPAFPVEHIAAVCRIYDAAYTRGEKLGRHLQQRDIRRALGL